MIFNIFTISISKSLNAFTENELMIRPKNSNYLVIAICR